MVYQDYQNVAIHVITDLTRVKSCETVEDNQGSQDHFHTRIAGGPPPRPQYRPSRPQAALESHVVHADSAYGAPAYEAAYGAPERILEKPKVELRTFFPENWLFDLQFTNETTLTR